jgi:hypothetical protein
MKKPVSNLVEMDAILCHLPILEGPLVDEPHRGVSPIPGLRYSRETLISRRVGEAENGRPE